MKSLFWCVFFNQQNLKKAWSSSFGNRSFNLKMVTRIGWRFFCLILILYFESIWFSLLSPEKVAPFTFKKITMSHIFLVYDSGCIWWKSDKARRAHHWGWHRIVVSYIFGVQGISIKAQLPVLYPSPRFGHESSRKESAFGRQKAKYEAGKASLFSQ